MNTIKKIFILTFCFNINLSIFCYVDNIFITTIPKCGTCLINKCINQLSGKKVEFSFPRDGEYKDVIWSNHIKYSAGAMDFFQKNKFKGIFLYRDPRDQIVSLAFVIFSQFKNHRFWESMTYDKKFALIKNNIKSFTLHNIITELINQLVFFNDFIPWMNVPFFYSVKFENIVGQKGGGNELIQRQTLKNICNFLEIPIDGKRVEECVNNSFGGTITFRQGKIGSWKKYFSPSQKTLFKKVSGNLLIKLGYEKNHNW